MIAILADIHANRPALEAVLAAARARGAQTLVVLGDLVGYHGEPDACVELLAGWSVLGVRGNHDAAALGGAEPLASRRTAEIQAWTARTISPATRAYLGALPARRELGWAIATHGTFTHPDGHVGYVTAITAAANLAAVAATGHRLGLYGHSHVPAMHAAGGVDRIGLAPGRYRVPAGPVIFNPGSVGQPRDGDPRAAFALVDPERTMIDLVRVPYDIDATVRALAAAGLDPSLGERLREAR